MHVQPTAFVRAGPEGAATRDRRAAHAARARLSRTPRGGAFFAARSVQREPRRSEGSCCGTALPRQDGEPEGGVVRDAAQRGADAGRPSPGCGASGSKKETSRGCRWRRPTTRRWRWSWPCARSTDWRGILKTQLARIENPDRKGRFEFVMPALSADPGGARALVPVARRRRTTADASRGCSKASNYLHHPLRAEASAKYVKPSLAICCGRFRRPATSFFPKRWMDATLSGHRSPAVAATVRAFLSSTSPNYPERLRNIVLQSRRRAVPGCRTEDVHEVVVAVSCACSACRAGRGALVAVAQTPATDHHSRGAADRRTRQIGNQSDGDRFAARRSNASHQQLVPSPTTSAR